TPPTGFGAPQPHPTMHYTAPTATRKPWLKGLLATGTAVAAVALLVGGVFLGRWLFTDRPPAAMAETITYGTGGVMSRSQFDVSPGGCGDNFLDPNTTINTVSCEKSHRVEYYAKGSPFGSSSEKIAYPGADHLREYAETFCTLHFMSDEIPLEDKENKLRYVAIVPTEGQWLVDPGDSSSERSRDIACVLWNKDKSALSDQVYKE
ncbi:MAG: serine/threonine protein kinase, partial [Saccharothrix sp.]|nr:serine/threonine protein kinase [Saccharothrix sp.]